MRTNNIITIGQTVRKALLRTAILAIATIAFFFATDVTLPQSAAAYPFWAQATAPDTPREATGRLVCANCHLGEKSAEIELPLSVLPDSVFEAVVKIPYDLESQQVLGDGSKGGLNVGAVVMLPDGFKLAPLDRIPEEKQAEFATLSYLVQPYNQEHDNWLIFGPLPGEDYEEVTLPILSPDPKASKDINFGKYSIYLGANRGRGQVYPTGDQTNNNMFTASTSGTITDISTEAYVGSSVTITTEDGTSVVDTVLPGPELVVAVGDTVAAGDALSTNPNVGGFGQEDAEIVLQDPNRIKGLIAFLGGVMLTQALLVIKKKQVEKVQAAEMNF